MYILCFHNLGLQVLRDQTRALCPCRFLCSNIYSRRSLGSFKSEIVRNGNALFMNKNIFVLIVQQ